MGNSGSIHNLHFEGAKSELGSYLQNQSQPLRRSNNKELGLNSASAYKYNASNLQSPLHTTEWRRSLGNPSTGKDSHTQFKVLPKLKERTHLRATTNGAILHSGGTISGRKDFKQFDKTLPIGIGMQRSRTFIDEPTTKDSDFLRTEKKHHGMTPEFNRSQTMLHVKVKSNKAEKDAITEKGSNLKPMQRHTYSEPDFCHTNKKTLNSEQKDTPDTFSKPGKLNKYNKKRRAPQAPTVAVTPQILPIEKETSQIPHTSHIQSKQQLFTKQYDRAKLEGLPRNATEKMTRGPKINERQPTSYKPIESFQRGNVIRNSMSSSQFQTQKLSNESQTKIPFRREKSSDAILLKNRNEKKTSVGANQNENLKPIVKTREQRTSDQRQSIKNLKEDQTNALQKTCSKIPQLKRTFYFGMDNALSAQKLTSKPTANQVESPKKISEEATNTFDVDSNENHKSMGSLPYIRSYDINIDKTNRFEDINDNGIMVHVRPTMPRRQFDTPTFSPSLAWRTLLKEQENLLRNKNPAAIGYSIESDKNRPIIEGNEQNLKQDSPIKATRVPRLRQIQKPSLLSKAWTPEQDLEDDDDDDEAEAILEACDESSSDDSKNDSDGFLFYGNKTGKSNNSTTPVHLFSLSLPRDAHIQNHLDSKALDKSHNYCSLQKTKIDFTFKRSDSHSPTGRRSSDFQFELKNKSVTKFDAGNNWVLYKNNNDSAGRAKGQLEPDDKQGIASIEPMSLKMLTGGKHVMYLPGHHEKSGGGVASSKENTSFITKTVPNENNIEQRQSKRRQRDLRENLQDATPVYPAAQQKSQGSTNNILADEDKPFHQRFTFQSTVRLLEKRRLADKLSRDAEIKEAQRKSEIEALKRVEEDFQRKRANEKANIRNQLQLYFGGNDDCRERYQSLPLAISAMEGFHSPGRNDTNNNNYSSNICCRDEPDGCVASSQLPSPEKELCNSDYINNIE